MTDRSSTASNVFSDFCQAWVARFPGSELPAAWEEDVRANLKKHKTKVAILKDELEKEEMYVAYLDKLLSDIERQRQLTKPSAKSADVPDSSALSTSKQEFLDQHLEDLQASTTSGGDPFITVINVSNSDNKNKASTLPSSASGATNKKQQAPPVIKTRASRESLNSVSSPTTPVSPFTSTEDFCTSPREALAASSSISSSNASSRDHLTSIDSSTTAGTISGMVPQLPPGRHRGQPDGRDVDEDRDLTSKASTMSTVSPVDRSSVNIKELMAGWENRHPIGSKQYTASASASGIAKPPRNSHQTRKDSDSSSVGRGRMGSPSGKSHESTDSDSWSRRRDSPGAVRRLSEEARLDRLVRRPSGGGSFKKSENTNSASIGEVPEPLYDTVAPDEPVQADEVYDNHLLYEEHPGAGKAPGAPQKPMPKARRLKPPRAEKPSPTSGASGASGSLDRNPSTSSTPLDESGEECNYVNIDYFLLQRRRQASNSSSSILEAQSDDELDSFEIEDKDKVFEEPKTVAPPQAKSPEAKREDNNATSSERTIMYKCILTSILESEAVYLEALSVLLQYMKAMKVTLNTPQPIIPKDDFEIIFAKVPELHELHLTFHENLKKQVERWDSSVDTIGHPFKMLASRTKIYAAYVNNYPRAIEALRRCVDAYPQFAELARSIKLRTIKGQRQGQSLSLEDLLHKPVARVQKHCLCLQDLIKHTPAEHPDYDSLNEALSTVQDFLNDYNMVHATELFPHQERPQRHLVKNSFIVELADGSRKLRHLFLFNDVLVCAKYKSPNHASSSSAIRNSEKFTFQLKWYIPLAQALIVEDPSMEPKETNPANLLSLRTQSASLRDQILRAEKEEELKGKRNAGHASKAIEKLRKKLAEVEAQLVLASPSLVFQVSNRAVVGKPYTFFISSEYERSQWVETFQVLQSSIAASNQGVTSAQAKNMSMYELQSWITSCRKFLKTNMGSFLMRSPRDEPLLVGDLIFQVQSLQGLTRPTDLYVVVEVDSYGHYFRKGKTMVIADAMEPTWNEEFVIDLEGSENLRILVYEENKANKSSSLRGRASLELSRTWLTGKMTEQRISMNDVVLVTSMKFVGFQETMRRVPAVTTKSPGLFGFPIQVATKREKRAVPFLITSCVREVERRGIGEVGIYRVSGSTADISRLKKAYEQNPYEAEQLLKEVDIHSVASTLKLYLRELPESLFTNGVYAKLFDAFTKISSHDVEARRQAFLNGFTEIPQNPNQACIVFLVEHIVRVAAYEHQNKMSLHNLATVFGPTMLHGDNSAKNNPGAAGATSQSQLTVGTVDVMAQAGILHFYLSRRAKGEPIQIGNDRQV